MQSSTFNQVARPAVRDRSMFKMLVMNSFTFILLFLSFQLFAGDGLAQRVTLNFRNAKVEDVIKEIQRQTTYNFLYFESDLKNAKAVTLLCNDAPLERALDLLKVNQPFELVVEGTTILLRSTLYSVPALPQVVPSEKNISGRITDPNGAPLGGATIRIKRTQRGTQANANGEFLLTEVMENDVLIFSYVGFQTKFVTVGKSQQFPIILEFASKELEMFVRRGYGGVSEKLNVGNVSVVKADVIERTNVANPIRALTGRIPNVEISSRAGNPYAPTKVEFRGRDLIANNAAPNPYILIDGIPTTTLDIGGQSNSEGSKGIIQNGLNGPGGGQDLLFNLNPDDVESITVLKDAAATAIYGSLGGGGVILITTKRGKPGKLKLEVNANTGVSKVTDYYEMLSTSEYIMMRKEAFRNSNVAPTIGNAPDLLVWDTTRYTDFQRYLYGRSAINNNLSLTISGGEKSTNYRISGSMQTIGNITNYSGSNSKGTLHASFNYSSPSQRIKIGFVNFFSHSKIDEITLNAGNSLLPPNAPPIFDSIGRLNYKGWQPLTNYFSFGSLLRNYTSKTDFLNSVITIEAELVQGLKVSANVGYSTYRNMQQQGLPIAAQDPARNPEGSAVFGNNGSTRWIIEPLLSYQKLIGGGKLEILAGATLHKNKQYGNAIFGSGYINDNLLNSISNAPNVTASDIWGQYGYAALFTRINYNYLEKYLVELSARRDGSSRFGPGNRYGNFGAVGVGWIFTEENWLKNRISFLSFGKLRGSFGLVGSDNIGDYNHLSRWTASFNSIYPYQGTTAYVPIKHSNPSLKWQTNNKLEIGLHLGFLDDRINFQSSWYRERCGNQLIEMPLSAITGFMEVTTNRDAVVENSGWEFTLRADIVKSKDFELSTNFNLGLNFNKLISFPNLESSPYAYNLVVGERLYRPQYLKFIGVNPQTGLYMVEDKNKDGVINTNGVLQGGDKYYYDDARIKYAGGFGTDLSWRGISLSMFFNFIRRPQLESAIYSNIVPGVLASINNQSKNVLYRWQKPGDISKFAKFTVVPDPSHYFVQQSDAVFSNGSFIRMKNIAISYLLPTIWAAKMKMSSARVQIKADNLLTFSNYEGIDPEIPVFGSVPTQKIITAAIRFTF